MVYAAVFCAATLSALLLLHYMPSPGTSLVKARLGALDALGPGVVPTDRAQQVLDRRRAKARQQQRRLLFLHGLKAAAFLLTLIVLLSFSASTWGLVTTVTGAFALGLLAWATSVIFRRWRGRRVAFQLPETVRLLADRLQESNSLDAALEFASQEAPRAAARELARVRRALRQGQTEERAFSQLARRNPSAEVEMLVSCLAVPHERGRRLAESLRPLQALLESRIRLARIHARRTRLVSWGLFVPVGAAMVYAGTSGSFVVLAAWTSFGIGTLLIAWVSSVKGGLA